MNDLNSYYKEVRSWLPCSRKLKESIMERLRDSIQSYLEQNPDADAAQVRAHFGTPEAIAAAYVDEMGTDTLLRDLRIRRKIVSLTAGALAFILALWMGVVGWAVAREIKSSSNTFTEETIGYLDQNNP